MGIICRGLTLNWIHRLLSFCRPAPADGAGAGAAADVHAVAAGGRAPHRLPRRQVHPEPGGADRGRRRLQRQLPRPHPREAGVQEGHRGEDTHVLLRQRQVRTKKEGGTQGVNSIDIFLGPVPKSFLEF